MRTNKVLYSFCCIIILFHLANAKSKIKRHRENSSKGVAKAAKDTGKQNSKQAIRERVFVEFVSDTEENNQTKNEDDQLIDKSKILADQLELAPLVKGMDVDQIQTDKLTDVKENIINRAPVIPKWQYGIISYRIDENVFDNALKVQLRKAMNIIEAKSCLIFKEITEHKFGGAWLHFTNPNRTRECVHEVEEGDSGDLIITLGLECMKTRDLLHAILHGLGFKDEVNHPHRDQYIRILWENIQPKYRDLFAIRRQSDDSNKLVEYDPMSIMHFHDRAFSANGGLTIASALYGLVIDPSDNLSQLDVMKLRLAFGNECNKRKVGDIVENCKNIFYKNNVGDKEETEEADDEDNEKDNNNENDDNIDSKEQHKGDDDVIAKKQDDIAPSEEIVRKNLKAGKNKAARVNNSGKHGKEEVTKEPISDVDDLAPRRFPTHLKFRNIH